MRWKHQHSTSCFDPTPKGFPSFKCWRFHQTSPLLQTQEWYIKWMEGPPQRDENNLEKKDAKK